MNIVLIGYRGTGKSTVANLLSARLGWSTFNMDKAIVEEAGMSIPQIV
jgi:shikimate kinase